MAARRHPLDAALRDLLATIEAERAFLRTAADDATAGAASQRLRDHLSEHDRLRRRRRDRDLGRRSDDACEEAALEWLNGLVSAEELLEQLVPDEALPFPEPPTSATVKVARLILRFRDAQVDGRIAQLSDLEAVRGVDRAWMAALLNTGCSRVTPPPPPAPVPAVGVLLPLRIETRFDPGRLRVRVVPDDVWFDYHDPRPSAGELDTLELATEAQAAATTDEERRLLFRQLAGQVGGARAVWLTRTFVTTGPGGAPIVNRPPDAVLRTQPAFPRLTGLPDTLLVWLARGGNAPAVALTLTVDHARLLLDPPEPAAGVRRWWEDWGAAVDAGLAGEIALSGDPGDIDLLLVTGLSTTAPAGLFTDHRDGGSLGVVAPGTPTNTVDGTPAAGLGDADAWWDVLQTPAGPGERAVSLALTGDPDRLGNLPGADEPHAEYAEAVVAALWPALWGFAATDPWAITRTDAGAAWASHVLFPEGPYPTLRFGAQPYGLLPATALRRWVAGSGDPPLEARLLKALDRLRELWREAAERRGTVAGADTEQLLDLLAQVPTAPAYRHREAWPLELWWFVLGLLGFGTSWDDLDTAWHAQYGLADELGLHPVKRYGTQLAPQPLTIPLVRPEDLAESRSVGDLLMRLVDIALKQPAAFAQRALLERELLREPLDSLLLRLAIRALQVALGDVGREKAGEAPPGTEPVWHTNNQFGLMERWIRSLTPQDLSTGTPATQALMRVVDGLVRLAGILEERLERLLRATVDTATYRIDPWLLALPTRRLQDLLAAAVPLRLGAYGWVDAPRPGTPGPTQAGMIHAPSPEQALSAAVLRDRAVNDADPGRWHLDLTSRTVRTAQRIAEHVRVGAHIAEALGREVERAVGAPADVARLRKLFPLRTEHAGRRTCDGLAVLGAAPATLGLTAGVLADLVELRAAVDAYGDLLVAEAIHHVTHARAEAAGAALDAAAGLSRPPSLDGLATSREGRTASTSVLVVVPDTADPPIPTTDLAKALQGPAALADASAAAFLVAQLGPGAAWAWTATDGTATVTVTLDDLLLAPADALALPLADLERLVAEAAAADLGATRADVELTASAGSDVYERAARLVALLGRSPAGPEAVAERPEVAATGAGAAGVDADLAARYARVLEAAGLLRQLLQDELALTTGGSIGSADPATLEQLVLAARQWGIAPDPSATLAPPDPLVAAAIRAEALLAARLDQAPAAPAERPALVEALQALVSPTGQLAVLGRLAVDDLPALRRAAGGPAMPGVPPLDTAWLPVVAAVREPLARLELHQLAAGSAAGAGPALEPWSSKPSDPWQQDASDPSRLVIAYAASGLDLAALTSADTVAAGVCERFTEVIPAEEQSTATAFGFDAPAARAPQAVLLAVPPDPGAPLDDETLRDVILETRELAHARMARPADLDAGTRGLLPSVLLPALGPLSVPLEPERH